MDLLTILRKFFPDLGTRNFFGLVNSTNLNETRQSRRLAPMKTSDERF